MKNFGLITLLAITNLLAIDAIPHKRVAEKTIRIPLTNLTHDTGFTMPIDIATQKFQVLFDTGSSDLWVAEKTCATCPNPNKFDPDHDYDLQTENNPFQITYGSGIVDGYIATTDFSLGGVVVPDQIFGATTSKSDDLNMRYDGIIGFGLDENSKIGATTPFNILVEQDKVEFALFSVFLGRARDGTSARSNVLLGDHDDRFNNRIGYTELVAEDQGRWRIPLGGVSVNDQTIQSNPKDTLIDTGSSYIFIPMEDILALRELIPDLRVGQQRNLRNGIIRPLYFPCNFQSTLTFNFDGVNYGVDYRDIIGQPVNAVTCRTKLAAAQLNVGNVWVLGIPFLQNVYTVFDTSELRVGFAALNNDDLINYNF